MREKGIDEKIDEEVKGRGCRNQDAQTLITMLAITPPLPPGISQGMNDLTINKCFTILKLY